MRNHAERFRGFVLAAFRFPARSLPSREALGSVIGVRTLSSGRVVKAAVPNLGHP